MMPTCKTRDEAARALLVAGQVLSRLGVRLNRDKTRIVPISQGLEFLGFKINPVLRGWGNYDRIGNVRKLYKRLGRWIVRRIWSHRRKRWRNCGWRELPETRLYGEWELVNLVGLIEGIRERGQAPKLL